MGSVVCTVGQHSTFSVMLTFKAALCLLFAGPVVQTRLVSSVNQDLSSFINEGPWHASEFSCPLCKYEVFLFWALATTIVSSEPLRRVRSCREGTVLPFPQVGPSQGLTLFHDAQEWKCSLGWAVSQPNIQAVDSRLYPVAFKQKRQCLLSAVLAFDWAENKVNF